jgi:hypothetical protein
MAEPTGLIQIIRPSTAARGGPGNVEDRTPPAAQQTAARPSLVEWPAVAERLREYAARRGVQTAAERCELCGAVTEQEHGHLVNVPNRALLCVCRPCYLLFTHAGSGGARFRAVPQRYLAVPELASVPGSWELLNVPIGLAFFFTNSATGRAAAFYPSPAGATESELPLDAWSALVGEVPILSTLEPDVEALIVRRRDSSPMVGGSAEPASASTDAFVAPIDACYELVGRIRRAWRGFQGGDDVWREIDEFFIRAADRARNARP